MILKSWRCNVQQGIKRDILGENFRLHFGVESSDGLLRGGESTLIVAKCSGLSNVAAQCSRASNLESGELSQKVWKAPRIINEQSGKSSLSKTYEKLLQLTVCTPCCMTQRPGKRQIKITLIWKQTWKKLLVIRDPGGTFWQQKPEVGLLALLSL
jgi:hypothetical protein